MGSSRSCSCTALVASYISAMRVWILTPSKAFLSIQGAAHRFSDQIRELQASQLERDGYHLQPSIDESDRNDHETHLGGSFAGSGQLPTWPESALEVSRRSIFTNQNRSLKSTTTVNTMTTGTATPVLMARGGGDDGTTVSTATESLGPTPLMTANFVAQHHHATFGGTLSPSTGEPHQSKQQRPFEVNVVGGGNNGNQNNSTKTTPQPLRVPFRR